MSIGGSGSRHKADSSFHVIPKVPRISDISTVLMMGINKCINEAHYRDAIVEASQKNLGDEVMEKMASPWMYSSLSPKRRKLIVQSRARIVMGERVGSTQHDMCVPVRRCGTFGQCTSHRRGPAAYQQPIQDEMHQTRAPCGVGCQQPDNE